MYSQKRQRQYLLLCCRGGIKKQLKTNSRLLSELSVSCEQQNTLVNN